MARKAFHAGDLEHFPKVVNDFIAAGHSAEAFEPWVNLRLPYRDPTGERVAHYASQGLTLLSPRHRHS